jgi:chorismate dehydratase
MRIGSVPYLNGKPLVDWFHSGESEGDVEIVYAVPSQLAAMLRAGDIDVANCSIFEGLQQPGLVLVPNISISADGAVKSVRLFSKVPLREIRSVALDTSSLTSSALTRILLTEEFGISPTYYHHAPNLDTMLARFDAGLIIGDLKLFDLQPNTTVYDLGQGWKDLTGLPFVYAGWLAREDRASDEMTRLLTKAKEWGVARLDALAKKWAATMNLPLDRCRDYLLNVMNYDLKSDQMKALVCFQQKCFEHRLIPVLCPLPVLA